MPRQTIYKRDGWDEKLCVIQGWARDGLTDEQIAGKMGIGVTTLYDYKKKYPEFMKALKKGKEVVDREVENSLLEQARSGNMTAIIFWLKNRKPRQWRDKQTREISGPEGGAIEVEQQVDLSGLSDKELDQLEKISEKIIQTKPD